MHSKPLMVQTLPKDMLEELLYVNINILELSN